MIDYVKTWFADRLFRRVFRNAGVLLGGHSVAGLLSLVNISLAARALGPDQFGILILIHTYALTVAEITGFESWHTVVRYGAVCLEKKDNAGLQNLIKLTGLLDSAGVVVGTVAAILVTFIVGAWLGWDEKIESMARVYSILVLFSGIATPSGLLRLFDRFDLLAAHVTVRSAARLAGVAIAMLVCPTLTGFLLVWFLSEICGYMFIFYMSWSELRRRDVLRSISWDIVGVTRGHKGIRRFILTTKLQASLQMLRGPLSVLLVGGLLGPAAAGIFRIAKGFAVVLVRPAELLSKSIYPDLSQLTAMGRMRDIRKLVFRSGLTTGCILSVVFVLMVIFGKGLIELTVGSSYMSAYALIVLLTLAAAIEGFGAPLNPIMYALGKPNVSIRVVFLTTIIYVALLVILTGSLGLPGAGWATIVNAVITVSMLSSIVFYYLIHVYKE